VEAAVEAQPHHHERIGTADTPETMPQSVTMTGSMGLLPSLGHFSTMRTTSMPDTTAPNTTCFPFRCGVSTVVIKNWLPLVLGPALAILNNPGRSCLSLKLSSLNLPP